jgi:shikimate kinase
MRGRAEALPRFRILRRVDPTPDDTLDARKRPIWLVGMMGCGKSSVGSVLARLLGRDFVDNDRLVEERAGRTIREIFDAEGEQGFRERETAAIDAVADGGAVVALGGGAIAQPGAPQRLAGLGTVVYLAASPDALLKRVGRAAARPLLAGLDRRERRERIVEMLAEREDAYRTAELVVETDGMGVRAVARKIAAALGASQ